MSYDWFRSVFIANLNIPKVFMETITQSVARFADVYFFAQGNKFDSAKPELYGRYIDDCFDATSWSKQELDYFIASVNSFRPPLKYTWVVSECCIASLDTNI